MLPEAIESNPAVAEFASDTVAVDWGKRAAERAKEMDETLSGRSISYWLDLTELPYLKGLRATEIDRWRELRRHAWIRARLHAERLGIWRP